jgi:prepilin-type N-terminal cleavage/methylation domain-containing protein
MRTEYNKGFTLLELLVSIGIFSVMLVIISGVFTNFAKNQRRQVGEQALQEDLRVALELFDKEARTGYGDTYAVSGSSSEVITFKNQNGTCVQYALSITNQMTRTECSGGGTTEPLTDPSTVVSGLKFIAYPAHVASGALTSQGYVTIVLSAHAKDSPDAQVNIQSSVTSRQYQPAP